MEREINKGTSDQQLKTSSKMQKNDEVFYKIEPLVFSLLGKIANRVVLVKL